MREGNIVEQGCHNDLLQLRGAYFELVNRQLVNVAGNQ